MLKLIRVTEESFLKIHEMARRMGISKQEIIDEALDKLERTNIMKQANEAYARLQKDSQAWKEEQEERALWDTTLKDGLEDE